MVFAFAVLTIIKFAIETQFQRFELCSNAVAVEDNSKSTIVFIIIWPTISKRVVASRLSLLTCSFFQVKQRNRSSAASSCRSVLVWNLVAVEVSRRDCYCSMIGHDYTVHSTYGHFYVLL
jgi:hypothetical protein